MPFDQREQANDNGVRGAGVNSFVVVLPKALQVGEEIILHVVYSGSAISQYARVSFVQEHDAWYPSHGEDDRALFNLAFHYPTDHTLVATGEKLKHWDESGLRHSTWRSEGESSLAGFSIGQFDLVTSETESVPVDVCAYGDLEPVAREVAHRRAFQHQTGFERVPPVLRPHTSIEGPPQPPDNTAFTAKMLAGDVLSEVSAAVGYFAGILGPYPYKRLTVSPIPADSSQGWPALIYVSVLSFLDSDQRSKLGLVSESDFAAMEFVRNQEIARQWVSSVAWRSYHDQWLSQGLANYVAAMYLGRKYGNSAAHETLLREARLRLLDRETGGKTKESAGAIWLGTRLASSMNRDGYIGTVYDKGLWVIHMLRMLMRNENEDPDEPFLKALREFFDAYKGRPATMWDFKRVFEKHMTSGPNLRGDRKLDWFFDQWVLASGIPKYELNYAIQETRAGFVIEGSIKQSDVDDSFVMTVPVYADDIFLGRVLVGSQDGAFRFTVRSKPSNVLIDPGATILAQ